MSAHDPPRPSQNRIPPDPRPSLSGRVRRRGLSADRSRPRRVRSALRSTLAGRPGTAIGCPCAGTFQATVHHNPGDDRTMKVGVLTGGGDCPGLNAVIRAVVRKGVERPRLRVRGLPRRLEGPARGPDHGRSASQQCRGILPRGGTILGSSRTNPFKIEGGVERIKENLRRDGRGRPRSRSAARTPSASPPSWPTSASTWSACRRRSTTTSPAPTSPSASTPRSTSRPRRSTGCTPPPSPTTGCWSSR